jgi:hypothetical protein
MKDASAASSSKKKHHHHQHHQRKRKARKPHQQLQLVGRHHERRRRGDDDDDDGDEVALRGGNAALVAELNRIRDAKIAGALQLQLQSAESGTTGVRGASGTAAASATRTKRAKSEDQRTMMKMKTTATKTEDQSQSQMKRRRGASESGVRGRTMTKKKGIVETPAKSSDVTDEEEDEDDDDGEESDDTTSARDLSPGHDERQCKMGWEKRWKAGELNLDDDGVENLTYDRDDADEEDDDDRSRSSSASSWEDSESESDSDGSSSESSDGSEETTEDEGRGKSSRDKRHTYNFYKNSLFREQQRLSSGLITPRKGPMYARTHTRRTLHFECHADSAHGDRRDRRAWTAEMVLHHRNSMLVSATAEWYVARGALRLRRVPCRLVGSPRVVWDAMQGRRAVVRVRAAVLASAGRARPA